MSDLLVDTVHSRAPSHLALWSLSFASRPAFVCAPADPSALPLASSDPLSVPSLSSPSGRAILFAPAGLSSVVILLSSPWGYVLIHPVSYQYASTSSLTREPACFLVCVTGGPYFGFGMSGFPPTQGGFDPIPSFGDGGSVDSAVRSPAVGDPAPFGEAKESEVRPPSTALPISRAWSIKPPFQKSRGTRDSTVSEELGHASTAAPAPLAPPILVTRGPAAVRPALANGADEHRQGELVAGAYGRSYQAAEGSYGAFGSCRCSVSAGGGCRGGGGSHLHPVVAGTSGAIDAATARPPDV